MGVELLFKGLGRHYNIVSSLSLSQKVFTDSPESSLCNGMDLVITNGSFNRLQYLLFKEFRCTKLHYGAESGPEMLIYLPASVTYVHCSGYNIVMPNHKCVKAHMHVSATSVRRRYSIL